MARNFQVFVNAKHARTAAALLREQGVEDRAIDVLETAVKAGDRKERFVMLLGTGIDEAQRKLGDSAFRALFALVTSVEASTGYLQTNTRDLAALFGVHTVTTGKLLRQLEGAGFIAVERIGGTTVTGVELTPLIWRAKRRRTERAARRPRQMALVH